MRRLHLKLAIVTFSYNERAHVVRLGNAKDRLSEPWIGTSSQKLSTLPEDCLQENSSWSSRGILPDI